MDSRVRAVAEKCFEDIMEGQVKKIKSWKMKNFKINPFTIKMLSQIGFGGCDPRSMARALVYPRILGTSLATSFGTRTQFFCVEAGFAKASGVAGMDIEFTDKINGRDIYAQLKAGPTTINKDDVKPMCDKFDDARRLFNERR